MRILVAAMALAAMLGTGAARAQTALDHDVQKTWDNLVNPGPRGDPRTNWERRQDDRRYEREDYRRSEYHASRRRDAERADWCRYHPDADGCGYRR